MLPRMPCTPLTTKFSSANIVAPIPTLPPKSIATSSTTASTRSRSSKGSASRGLRSHQHHCTSPSVPSPLIHTTPPPFGIVSDPDDAPLGSSTIATVRHTDASPIAIMFDICREFCSELDQFKHKEEAFHQEITLLKQELNLLRPNDSPVNTTLPQSTIGIHFNAPVPPLSRPIDCNSSPDPTNTHLPPLSTPANPHPSHNPTTTHVPPPVPDPSPLLPDPINSTLTPPPSWNLSLCWNSSKP